MKTWLNDVKSVKRSKWGQKASEGVRRDGAEWHKKMSEGVRRDGAEWHKKINGLKTNFDKFIVKNNVE